jgi:hypothetical protein
MKHFVSQAYQQIKKRRFNPPNPQWMSEIHALASKIEEQAMHRQEPLKVLIGPSFAIWDPSYALDLSLSYALQLRGIEVVSMYCDGIQENECNFFGGPWNGGKTFNDNCISCQRKSQLLWSNNLGHVLKLSDYIQLSERQKVRDRIQKLNVKESLDYEENGIKYGLLAKDISVNNHLVASLELVPDYENLLKTHISNLIIVSKAYERILEKIRPDRVISNDSYYGMWAVLEYHCKNKDIPFYSHWPVTKDRVAFGSNDAAMNLNFKDVWPKFSKIELNNEETKEIEAWMQGERGLFIDTTKPTKIRDHSLDHLQFNKPTILLAANVIWDLAALNKQIVFDDMIDWIIKTIQWFENRQEYQLIIKPHPVETSKDIPNTKETVSSRISEKIENLPHNVILLKSETHVTANDLVELVDIRAVTVHTTTVGFEIAARGFLCITTGRSPYRGFGFTIDPEDQHEYFKSINDLLSSPKKEKLNKERVDLVYRFIKFYHFHYYSKLGLFNNSTSASSSIELNNFYFDKIKYPSPSLNHVLTSIIDGKAINSNSQWLPKS